MFAGDLFPAFEVPTPDYSDLTDVIKDECAKICIIPTDFFLAKCVQIYEVSVLRHGFMTGEEESKRLFFLKPVYMGGGYFLCASTPGYTSG